MDNEVDVTNELIPVERINVPQLFTDIEKAKVLVSAIRDKAGEHEADLSTDASRKAIASNAYKVSQSKTFLDGLRKEFLADLKSQVKSGDAIGKYIRDECDAIRDEVRKPLTDWENAEKERIEKEKALAEFLADWDDALAEDDLFNRQREIERKEAEFARQEEERKAKEEAERLEKERIEREKRIAAEAADKAKRDSEEKARREREEAERKQREAIEAAERAEREKKEAQEQAERDSIAAEKQAKEDQERAVREAHEKERQRIEAEQRAKAEKERAQKEADERRARHHAHVKKIKREAVEDLVSMDVDMHTAQDIVSAISKMEIRNITINY